MDCLLVVPGLLIPLFLAALLLRFGLPRPPAIDAWVQTAESFGLSGLDPTELRGVVGPFEVRLQVSRSWLWPDRVLQIPRPDGISVEGADELADRLSALVVRRRWDEASGGDERIATALRNRDAVFSVLEALGSAEDGLRCVIPRVRGADREAVLGSVLVLAPWIAEQLGWARVSERGRLALTARGDADPMVRQRALLRLLGGWSSATPPDDEAREVARAALEDPDPWIRGAAAVHLLPESAHVLEALLCEAETAHVLVAKVVDTVGPELPPATLARLLEHGDLDLVTAVATHLQAVGTPSELSALRRVGVTRRLNPLGPGRAISRAIAAIEARASTRQGWLSEVPEQAGGELAVVEDPRGHLSPTGPETSDP